MMKRAATVVLLVASVAVADVIMKNAGNVAGPVTVIDCTSDGGVVCSRTASKGQGNVACASASTTEKGCLTPAAQSLAGDKTWTGFQRITGVAHGSLVACDSGHKNMLQGCTTHGAPVWCDGTSNHELLGSSGSEQELRAVYVNGIPTLVMDWITISSGAGWTVSAVTGLWGAGSGAGSLPIRIAGASGTCSCNIDCDAPLKRSTCTGTCTFSAGDTLLVAKTEDGGCTTEPFVAGNLSIMGTTP
jgi:hypothetical protein